MSKKKISLITSILAILSLSVFSIANAFALEGDNDSQQLPTSPVQICIDLSLSLKDDIAAAKAKGLSQQVSAEEIEKWVKDIKNAKKQACKEAKALTSPAKICNYLKSNFAKDIKTVKAKGLSLQLSQEEIDQMVKDVKDAHRQACKEAKALTTPVKVCKNLKASLNVDMEAAKAKGLSLQLSQEEIDQWIKDIKAAKKKACDGAKIYNKIK